MGLSPNTWEYRSPALPLDTCLTVEGRGEKFEIFVKFCPSRGYCHGVKRRLLKTSALNVSLIVIAKECSIIIMRGLSTIVDLFVKVRSVDRATPYIETQRGSKIKSCTSSQLLD